jgi:predicted ester cyclase
MKMDQMDIVKAYYAALDADDMDLVNQYLSADYQLVDFVSQSMDRESMLAMVRLFKDAMPNLRHSLSNLRVEGSVVKMTVQLSGNNSGHLDLRSMGIGVVPRSDRFIIFPNGNFEYTVKGEKIVLQRDVSPISPNRRMSGMIKAMGVNVEAM